MIRVYYQRLKCKLGTLVSGDIRFVRLFTEVLWRGSVKQEFTFYQRQPTTRAIAAVAV